MAHSLKVYLIVLPVFLLVDYLWLAVVMSGFYRAELGALARTAGAALAPRLWAAAIVYLLIPAGTVLLVLPRVDPNHLFASALLWGLLYGVVLYGVYDFTNHAVLADWPLTLTLVDIAWGAVLNAAMALVAALVDRWLR